MGTVIDRRYYKNQRINIAQALFIVQSEKLLPADAKHINIGLYISDVLRDAPPAQRASMLQPEFDKLLTGTGTDVVLERIDILFDPIWDIDVLKFLLAAGRNRRIYILWPGSVIGSRLEYADQGRADHKVYEIMNYNDTYFVAK